MHATLNFHEWHEFYLLLGTVAGALVALLFVAVSVAVGYVTDERSVATRKRPLSDRPAPPPITMPSRMDTWGLRSWLICQHSVSSARK